MLVCGHLDNVKREVGCCLCIHARSVDQSHHMHEARVEKIARVELTVVGWSSDVPSGFWK
jgi:hypothetical protein